MRIEKKVRCFLSLFTFVFFSKRSFEGGGGAEHKGETEKVKRLVMVEITIFQLCFCTSRFSFPTKMLHLNGPLIALKCLFPAQKEQKRHENAEIMLIMVGMCFVNSEGFLKAQLRF